MQVEKDNITASGTCLSFLPFFLSGQEVLQKAFGKQSDIPGPNAPVFQQLQGIQSGVERLSVMPATSPSPSV